MPNSEGGIQRRSFLEFEVWRWSWRASANSPVQAVRKESEVPRGAAQIHDIEHLVRRATECEPVRVGRDDVGAPVLDDPLIAIVGSIDRVAEVRDLLRRICCAASEEDRTHRAG